MDWYTKDMNRCAWARSKNPLMAKYHDEEWGVPVHNDRKLFEFIILEGAQAGLSWETILNRRKGYKRAFANFDPRKVARFTKRDVNRLLQDTGIIRNRLKIRAAIENAKSFLQVQKEFGTFSAYIWGWVNDKPIQNKWKSTKDIPAVNNVAVALSKDMKERGFRFFGQTICYAHMQACGMVNDHTTDCFRHRAVSSYSHL